MLLASALNVALGWAWHTGFRARHYWTLRREGALIAAAAVVIVGTIDVARVRHEGEGATAMPSAMLAATATTVLTETTPPAVEPVDGPPSPIPLQMPASAEATPSPALDEAPQVAESSADPIGAIASGKLYNDSVPTGSIAPKPRPRHARRGAAD